MTTFEKAVLILFALQIIDMVRILYRLDKIEKRMEELKDE